MNSETCTCGHDKDDHVEDGCNARVGADGKLCPCEVAA
jgi:hypothetical protein